MPPRVREDVVVCAQRMLKGFYKPKEFLSLNFQQPPKRVTFSCGFCLCKRSASVGSHPSVITAVSRNKPGHGAVTQQALVDGCVPSGTASLCGPPLLGAPPGEDGNLPHHSWQNR